MVHNNRRGQVTVFIILGLIILISSMIFLGMKGKLTFFDPDAIINPDKTAVKNFVEACLRDTAKDAATLAAFQGGYATIDAKAWKLGRQGNFESMLGEDGFKIPYWVHEGDDSYIPEKEDVEKSIELYVDQRIENCLDNLSMLRKYYDLKVLGKPKSYAAVGSGRITIQMDYPIMLKTLKKSGNTKVDNFYATVNSNFYDAWQLARLIVKDNKEHFRLWNLTMEMIAAADFPYKGFEIDCTDRRWKISDLQRDFDAITAANYNFLRYKNTKNMEDTHSFFIDGVPKYYQFKYTYDIGATNRHKKFTVRAQPLSTTRFNVFPNDHNVYATSLDIDFPIFGDLIDPCLNIFNHFYTLDYAVKFTIYDDEGLNFNFILPINVDYNKPKTDFSRHISNYDTKLLKRNFTLTNSQYCREADHNVTIFAKDAITKKGILNATVYYKCVSYECEIGQTSYPKDRFGSVTSLKPNLKGKFPTCQNGNLVVQAKDYVESSDFITPSIDKYFSAYLKPIVKLRPTFSLNKLIGRILSNPDKDNYENASVLVSVINHDLEMAKHSSFKIGQKIDQDNYIKVPVNDSYENNISVSVMVIEGNYTIGGFEKRMILDGKRIVGSETFYVPIILANSIPRTPEDSYRILKDEIIPKSEKFDIELR